MAAPRILLFGVSCNVVASWKPLGSTISAPSTDAIASFGAVVKVSEDGRRIAVGSPSQGDGNGNGAVMIYDLDSSTNWKLAVTIPGFPGEGLGNALSLSPDGLMVAIRRHHVSPSAVQVYQVLPNATEYNTVGSTISSCPDNGTEAVLSQATISADEGSKYYLLVSCEHDHQERGLIQAYELKHHNSHAAWTPFLPPLRGDTDGDRFGSALAMVEAVSVSGNSLRVAVSAPRADSASGYVRVFTAHNGQWQQLGDDLVGTQPGESFGSSLAMSATDQPYVVVGSPKKRLVGEVNPHGMVQLFHWRSLVFGAASDWDVVGVPRTGLNDRDLFGHAVSISRDGGRWAAASLHHDSERGYVRVYERDTYNSLKLVGNPEYGLVHGAALGTSVALNGPGSVLIVGAPNASYDVLKNGAIHAWVDDSSFCQAPAVVRTEHASSLDLFISRQVCRDGVNLVYESNACVQTTVFAGGHFHPCQWESRSIVPTESPTTSFSKTLTIQPSTRGPTISNAQPSSYSSSTMAPVSKSSSAPNQNLEPTLGPMGSPTSSSGNVVSAPAVIQDTEDSSPAPTMVPETEPTTYAPTIPRSHFIRACRCNERDVCITKLLPEGSDLRVCIQASTSEFQLVAIDSLSLEQGDLSINIVEDGQASFGNVTQSCIDDVCSVVTSIPSGFFGENRPESIDASGFVLVDAKTTRRLRPEVKAKTRDRLKFHTAVRIERLARDDAALRNNSAKGSNDSEGVLLWVLLPLFGAILAGLGCFMWRRSKKYKMEYPHVQEVQNGVSSLANRASKTKSSCIAFKCC